MSNYNDDSQPSIVCMCSVSLKRISFIVDVHGVPAYNTNEFYFVYVESKSSANNCNLN